METWEGNRQEGDGREPPDCGTVVWMIPQLALRCGHGETAEKEQASGPGALAWPSPQDQLQWSDRDVFVRGEVGWGLMGALSPSPAHCGGWS